MQPRLSHSRIKKTMGNSLGSTELAHLEPGVKNFHVPKPQKFHQGSPGANRILGDQRFLNNFGRNSGKICGPFPGIFVARPKSGSCELAPLAFARASSKQAMIGCSKQWFTLFLEKERKEENRAHERGKLHAPPPGGHSSGWCLRKQVRTVQALLSSNSIYGLLVWNKKPYLITQYNNKTA